MTENLRFDLWEKLNDLSIDDSTKLSSEALFFKLKQSESEIDELKSLILMRCCTLIVSKSIKTLSVDGSELPTCPINISNFLKGSASDLSSYLYYLEKLLSQIPQDLKLLFQDIIRRIEISTIIYKKFKDMWDHIDLKGSQAFTSSFLQMLWLLTINLKHFLNLNSIFESGYLLIGVYTVAIESLEPNSSSLDPPYVSALCGILKANLEQSAPWVSNVRTLLIEYLSQGRLCSKTNEVSGVFSGSVTAINISLLSGLYQEHLTQDDFDERDLILFKQKIRTPQKPRCLRLSRPHEIVGKVLRWDENFSGPSIASKLLEVNLPPPSPFIPPPTPMTMAMELNNWFVDLIEIDRTSLEGLRSFLPEYAFNIVKVRLSDMLDSTKRIFTQRNIGTKSTLGMMFINENFEMQETCVVSENNSRVDELGKFFIIVFSRVIAKEADRQVNVESLAVNEEFHRGLYACCLEALLYLHSVVSINFDDVLDICGIRCFEFWKVINSFSQFDTHVPQSLRRHFREIEVKIISQLAWKEGSQINLAIKQLISSCEEASDTNLLLKRVLSHCANRILELTNSLTINDAVKEEVWVSFKYLLSEKTELLTNRHVDHMIICTIYGVCKVYGSVTFKQLVDKYRQLYLEEPNFFKNVYIDEVTEGDIITFYNTIYIRAMKDFLTHKVISNKPRIDILHPPNPLKECVPHQIISSSVIASLIKSPIKSPFRTPRSEVLWARSETFSPMPKPNFINKKITFDPSQPTKKPKIIENILKVREEDIGPAPTLRKDSSNN